MNDVAETARDQIPTTETFSIPSQDGFCLGLTRYAPRVSAAGNVVIAGCIGAPQRYYRHFAQFLASEGYSVVTFDYRGIGQSRSGSLRGFRASLEDWAEKDLESVVNWSIERGKTAVVGHSFGGHAFGLLSRVNELVGLYTFASGAGHHSYMSPWEASKVRLMWGVLGPALISTFGYLPSKRIGLGEDLPLGVYQQWREWCASEDYFFADRDKNYTARFAKVTVPVHAVAATDDPWSPPKSVRAFIRGYTAAEGVRLDEIAPKSLGQRQIGHMGYFRPAVGRELWTDVVKWFGQRNFHGLAAPSAR